MISPLCPCTVRYSPASLIVVGFVLRLSHCCSVSVASSACRLFHVPEVSPAESMCSWFPESRRSSSVSPNWLRHRSAPVWRCRADAREEPPPHWGWSEETEVTWFQTHLSALVHTYQKLMFMNGDQMFNSNETLQQVIRDLLLVSHVSVTWSRTWY